jgi:hypothetical protein
MFLTAIVYWFFLIPHPSRVGLTINEELSDPIHVDKNLAPGEALPLGLIKG